MKKFRATAKPRLQGLNDYQKAIVYGLYMEETTTFLATTCYFR